MFTCQACLGDKHSDILRGNASGSICDGLSWLEKLKVRRSTIQQGSDTYRYPVLSFRKRRKLYNYSLLSPSWTTTRCGQRFRIFLLDISIMVNCTLHQLRTKKNFTFLEFILSEYFLTVTRAIMETLSDEHLQWWDRRSLYVTLESLRADVVVTRVTE